MNNFVNKILTALVDRLIQFAMKTPYVHIPEYMNRYWLIPYNDGGFPFFAMRIHQILRSDDDRHFHDHPWPYLTIILRGGYTEVKPVYDKSGLYKGDSRKWYGAGSILFRRSNSWHRLEVPEGQTTWTLFTSGKYQQKWGFLQSPIHKVSYTEYLDISQSSHYSKEES